MNEANIEDKKNNNLFRVKIRKSFTILERTLKPRPRADTNFEITIRKKEIGVSQKLGPSPTCLSLFLKRIQTWIHRCSVFFVNTFSRFDCIHCEKHNTIFPENI